MSLLAVDLLLSCAVGLQKHLSPLALHVSERCLEYGQCHSRHGLFMGKVQAAVVARIPVIEYQL